MVTNALHKPVPEYDEHGVGMCTVSCPLWELHHGGSGHGLCLATGKMTDPADVCEPTAREMARQWGAQKRSIDVMVKVLMNMADNKIGDECWGCIDKWPDQPRMMCYRCAADWALRKVGL